MTTINRPINIEPIKKEYTQRAYTRLGISAETWHPKNGFKANRAILESVYYAYQSLYFDAPNHFLWAGLARLTGGQVLFGMNNLTKFIADPCVLTQEIVAVAKDIFDNLAWQHELFLEDKQLLLAVCKEVDKTDTSPNKYADCWQLIQQNDTASIAKGNKKLLENEQHNIVQPHYNRIKLDAYSKPFFYCTRFVMRNIHPYHRWFFADLPFRDVTVFENRWRWISHEKGMWESWTRLSENERSRLVGLSNEAVIRHEW